MIIVKLMGGLGNQMFQYAMGRRLALGNGMPLKLDLSMYEGTTPDAARGIRGYMLGGFNTVAEPASGDEVMAVCSRLPILARAWEKVKPWHARRWIIEPGDKAFVYASRLATRKIRGSVYVKYGFWQSWRYAEGIKEQLRQELTFKQPPAGLNGTLADEISGTESVCVHVRHGDNVSVSWPLGALGADYYRSATERILASVERPHFYVFSDDPAWARRLVSPGHPCTYVKHNDTEHVGEDLRLMSRCRHHITANSTLSWWGAWLGRRPGQIVIAPRRYYQEIDRPNPDLYPGDWSLL
jgi:hypothetical protein